MIKSKRQMFIVIGVFALVMLLGTVTFAFFNYTRTGAINNLGTGRIYFNSSQSECVKHTLNLVCFVRNFLPNFFVRNFLAFLWESHHLFKSLVHL